ncbi:MAG TPA: metalloregulator ArsR/SmtB family transcription factor [Bacteroidota bacterium]|jgi:ArsR family transcriptional regulator|nr:metalloregulator ArsR/SmtB family transcription factor [Bacteroidota bacterium]
MKDLLPIFSALADESRLRILHLLFESGELCVCDIESTLGFTQTKVSRHLAYLRRAGLISSRRSGRWILCAIARPRTEHQRTILEGLGQMLQSYPRTQRDSAKLKQNAQNGCCATFVHVKPGAIPAKAGIDAPSC